MVVIVAKISVLSRNILDTTRRKEDTLAIKAEKVNDNVTAFVNKAINRVFN